METNYLPDEAPFVNEECGDTMWNDENLNPPRSNSEKPLIVERLQKKIEADATNANSK